MASRRLIAYLAQLSTRPCPRVRTGLRAAADRALSRAIPATAPAKPVAASRPSCISSRRYSQTASSARIKTWDFEEIQKIVKEPKNMVIVDVREASELQETGRIPGAIHIPITTQPDSFHVTDEEFEDRLGYPRPDKDTELLTYCRSGVRAHAAAEIARAAGWTKLGEYPGSWLDWTKKGGAVQK